MTVKCKKCGNSYERKYRVCPQCGTVRFVAPIYLKVLATVAGCYLVLTAIMLPLDVFQFTPEPSKAPTETKEVSPPEEEPLPSEGEPLPSADAEAPPGEAAPETLPPGGEPSEEPGTGSLTIKTAVDTKIFDDGEEFTWYKDRGALQVSIVPEPDDDSLKPEWKSSDKTVFTIDENGLLTPIWAENNTNSATLTVTYGSAKASFTIRIAPKA